MDANKALQQAIDFIEENLCERLEPEFIAEAAYMSVPNLYRVFYALTGHPLMDYIRKRRINRAAISLRHSDLPILDIAFECGFDSYRTFAAAFKKMTGLTPGMYRKADFYYSFERVNLHERIRYREDRELSQRYSDVKVIRIDPMQAIAYLHTSQELEGLEEDAFRIFYNKLSNAGITMDKALIFGYNLEPEQNAKPSNHEYFIFYPTVLPVTIDRPDLFLTTLPGGLYAVSKSLPGPPSVIIAAWNRMLEEWLPRSCFSLGGHPFVEEFLHHHGKVTRLKLYLPVMRKSEQETIGIESLQHSQLLVFRSTGSLAKSSVDDQMTAWLIERGLAGDHQCSLFMSHSYGITEEDDSWYELALPIPDNFVLSLEETERIKWLEGGLYAYMTTGAYGVMTGVLDMLHEWLCQNNEYQMDDQRQWFAKYSSGSGADVDRSTIVTCYLPIVHKKEVFHFEEEEALG